MFKTVYLQKKICTNKHDLNSKSTYSQTSRANIQDTIPNLNEEEDGESLKSRDQTGYRTNVLLLANVQNTPSSEDHSESKHE